MASQYTYDEEGAQFLTFLLTILLLVLVPASLTLLPPSLVHLVTRTAVQATSGPIKEKQGWFDEKGQKLPRVRQINKKSWFSFRLGRRALLVLGGWIAVFFLFRRVNSVASTTTQKMYDPFSILGISASATEKEIKKHYKKLSIKFHPDKLRLKPNQTKEEAESHYIDLTKAYKALTDETIRKNYELYGHPDGKQETSMGIALPTWISESQNNIWVLGAYGIIFGMALPYLVARWWYGSRSRTKDGVINQTAQTFFQALREDTPSERVLMILSVAEEFNKSSGRPRAIPKREAEALDAIEKALLKRFEETEGKTVQMAAFPSPGVRRTMLLLLAYLHRIEISDSDLDKERYLAALQAERLLQSLLGIALAHNWMDMTLLLMTHIACFVQAVPTSPTLRAEAELLQLPHVGFSQALKLARKTKLGDKGLQGFLRMEEAQRRKMLGVGASADAGPGLSEEQYAETMKVANEWPRLEVLDMHFKVPGERLVTTGAIVSFVVKARLLPARLDAERVILQDGVRPGTDPSHMELESSVKASSEEDVEQEVASLTSGGNKVATKAEAAEGKETLGVAHAPYFPQERKPHWWVTIVDPKQSRVIVQPTRMTDVGASLVRTYAVQFQAPPQAGLYTFVAVVKSDSFLASEAAVPVKLKVEDSSVLDDDVVDDDISDPEEDTLAGQMAIMKGERVKASRRDDDDEDDDDGESGTNDDEDDEEGEEEESDWD